MKGNHVSVVIPVYNGENFVENAIESVLQQTIKPVELIVVNDGSTDNTAEKLTGYGSSIVVINLPHRGVASARNAGISLCTGEFVAFLDADDVWYQDKLKQQLEVFSCYPEVGFCCCDFITFNKEIGLKVSHFSQFKGDEDFNFDEPLKKSALELLMKTNYVGTSSNVMFRRQLIDIVGLFDEGLKQSEDYDMWIRFALVTNFVLLSAELMEKKAHDANLTNNFLETLLFREKVLIKLASTNKPIVKVIEFREKYQRTIALGRYEIGNILYESGLHVQAFKYFYLGLVASLTYKNLRAFSYFFGRKLLRTLSFGLIKNKHSAYTGH